MLACWPPQGPKTERGPTRLTFEDSLSRAVIQSYDGPGTSGTQESHRNVRTAADATGTLAFSPGPQSLSLPWRGVHTGPVSCGLTARL